MKRKVDTTSAASLRWWNLRAGPGPDLNAPIRCSFRCRIPQDEEVGDIVLVARFDVAPKALPAERPPIVQEFIEDARVAERG